jgi:uncharacterized protein YndB with AHSA1/START domain
MKIMKRVFYALLVVLATALIVALFIPKDYTVEREIIINQPKNLVFDYLKYLRNQETYSVWYKIDLNMEKTYKGTDGKVGFVSGWKSKNENVGEGTQEITKIVDGKRIEFKLLFKEPMESENQIYITTTALSPGKTKVKWGFKGSFPYPMNLFRIFIDIDDAVGKDFEGGLKNLKKELDGE